MVSNLKGVVIKSWLFIISINSLSSFFYFTACNWKHRGQVHSSCHRSSGGLLTGNRVIHLVTETTTARNNRKHYIVSLNKTMNLNFPKPPYYRTSERYKEKIVYKETLIFLVCLHNAT